MTAPTMRTLLPKTILPALKALGQHDWLTWRPAHTNPPTTEYHLQIPDDPALDVHDAFISLLHRPYNDPLHLLRLFAYSKTLTLGPKLLRPTTEQCEALRHVDVKVRLDEYQQPFPSMIVELPDEFRRRLTEEFAWKCPRFVVNYFDERTRYLFSFCETAWQDQGTCNIIAPRRPFSDIEQALQFTTDKDGPDLRQGAALQRVACNFALMLTRFGVKESGPLDPKSHCRNQRQAKSRKPHKARRAQAMLDAAFTEIGFEQDVVFYSERRTSNGNSDPTGRVVRTHWRRGHFRRQRHGSGLSETKLVFIRPCLVNAEHFNGDLADTEYRVSINEGQGDTSPPAAKSQVSRIGGC